MGESHKVLVANRGEIAIRVLRAANEMGKSTVAVFAAEDKLSLHRAKSDEAYQIGVGLGPVEAYLNVAEILRIADETGADAIHPGYGFLSESPEFAEACVAAGVTFIGPSPDVLRNLGNKVSAREIATAAGVPTLPATAALPESFAAARACAEQIGFPAMLKASWGGGGRGMRAVANLDELEHELRAARTEAAAAFGKSEIFLERWIPRARHLEVQVLADSHGNFVHLFERDCSVQRRNQKIVECAPAPNLTVAQRTELCEHALAIARHAQYCNAGTVEFLQDLDSGEIYFIEVNPRIQVEHTVTEQITGVDLVRAQIRVAEGAAIGADADAVCPAQADIQMRGHAIQCRITTEDPLNRFIPDYGRLTAYRGATGFGIRLDGGTAYSGAVITQHFDSLLEKVTAWGTTRESAVARLRRALREFRIRGVATNIPFLERVVAHPDFLAGNCTTRFVDNQPELLEFPRPRDRAGRLLRYIAEITVNGHPEVRDRPKPPAAPAPRVPPLHREAVTAENAKSILDSQGPEAVAGWMLAQDRVLITDTTMRDAPQSLLATRMRTYDLVQIATAYARNLPNLFSLECWGGATFDVALRFLDECPWERLELLRERMPNHMLQMLLRASNAVGYTNYPDNAVRHFVTQAAQSGIDVFRVFDPLNWVDNIHVAMDAVRDTGKICEAAICYTGDIHDPARPKYNLNYYVELADQLHQAGAHVLAIKDMAGLLKPAAAAELVQAIKAQTGLPIHVHTHDTSGIAAASLLAAVAAGADAIDLAMDSCAGLTSQPALGSVTAALRDQSRDPGIDASEVHKFSEYWERVRIFYTAFESDLRAPASEIYLHEMPGGQFTNLREQARALGLADRWHEVATAYAEVNQMFGDIIKVTPTSKVVGDLALAMVAGGFSRADVEDPQREIAFPESVVGLFRGELGQPPGGLPPALTQKILKGQSPIKGRPGAQLLPVDFAAARTEANQATHWQVTDNELCSWLMYPKQFAAYAARRQKYGPVSKLPTPVFFYGLPPGEEISVELERGITLVIRCLAIGETDANGHVRVFFELNGQPRVVLIDNEQVTASISKHPRADIGNPNHVAAPMPGAVVSLAVSVGQHVVAGDLLMTIEAMKMETALHAERDGTVAVLHVNVGDEVEAKDLLLEYGDT